MDHRLRSFLAATFLAASILACNLPQTSPTPPIIMNTPSPTPDIETVDEFFARCPSAAEVSQVNSNLGLGFEYDPTAGTFVCTAAAGSADLTALQKRAYQTVYVMRLLHFSKPLPWTDKQLYDWLVGTIEGIRFINGNGNGVSSCCSPARTIVIALDPNSTILIDDQWVVPATQNGLMFVMALFVHEARHSEGYNHTCPDYSGNDSSLNELGSWGVQYYLSLWIAQYGDRAFLKAPDTNPNIYRQIALDDAQWTRGIRFCTDPTPAPGPTLMP